jgi:hypothetical protein
MLSRRQLIATLATLRLRSREKKPNMFGNRLPVSVENVSFELAARAWAVRGNV